jgi:hypothetical protein
MMSASPFSTLPSELICLIFKSADDFTMVAALAQTARIFYHTWRENPTSICQAVAPRILSNLPDATRLVDIQEEADAVNESQDGREQKSIIRAKRLLLNARCASAACDRWVTVCRIHECYDRGEDPHMRPSELGRFERAFYRVWAIGVMEKVPHLQKQASAFLDECSPAELCRLEELASWATYYNENDFGSLDLDLRDGVWKVGCKLVTQRWMAYLNERDRRMLLPHDTPFLFFAFFDHTQGFFVSLPDE